MGFYPSAYIPPPEEQSLILIVVVLQCEKSARNRYSTLTVHFALVEFLTLDDRGRENVSLIACVSKPENILSTHVGKLGHWIVAGLKGSSFPLGYFSPGLAVSGHVPCQTWEVGRQARNK